ncbi:MAG TPA: hypothetical protein VHX59_12350 [Mycobacteriales bacterium]|jgi:hypothetical protein|nr:hypothetical protein [Mycobacteriales bacterium]
MSDVRRTRPASTRRLARYLRWRHNSMARRTDRIESAVAGYLLVIFLLSLPVAGWLGRTTYAGGSARAHAAHLDNHRGTAVLLTDAPAGTAAGIDAAPADPWVRASWVTPDGRTHTGQVEARSGTAAGTTVPIWLDSAGRPTAGPASALTVVADAVALGVCLMLLTAAALEMIRRLTRRLLDRSRLADWEADWQRTGPRWRRPAR